MTPTKTRLLLSPRRLFTMTSQVNSAQTRVYPGCSIGGNLSLWALSQGLGTIDFFRNKLSHLIDLLGGRYRGRILPKKRPDTPNSDSGLPHRKFISEKV